MILWHPFLGDAAVDPVADRGIAMQRDRIR